MDAADKVWVCRNGHVDDFHGSVDGQPERCSRCGGHCEEISLDGLARIAMNHRYFLGAAKSWLDETEKRVKLLDTRGEARLIPTDDNLRTAIRKVT